MNKEMEVYKFLKKHESHNTAERWLKNYNNPEICFGDLKNVKTIGDAINTFSWRRSTEPVSCSWNMICLKYETIEIPKLSINQTYVV